MEKKFSKDHEWMVIENNLVTVGISDYAQRELGDVVFVSLTRDVGDTVSAGDDIAEIESVKSVSQVYSPVDGELAEFNEIFEDESQSGIVNQDPYGEGWIFKVKVEDSAVLDSFMSEAEYEDYIETL